MTEIPGLEFRLSIAGGPGNANSQADPNASLGGFVSVTKPSEPVIVHNLFPSISQFDSTQGSTKYRVLFVVNTSDTPVGPLRLYVSSQIPGGAALAFGLDPMGSQAIGSAGSQSATIANENTAPAGVTFSAPTTPPTGLLVGTLQPNTALAIHVRRTLPAGTGEVRNDGATVRAQVVAA